MTTLEKIKAEIKNTFLWDGQDEKNLNTAVRKCLEIIDKYASEECDNDCEHCTYIECPKEPSECQWHEKEDNICWNEDKPFIECPIEQRS